MTDGGPAGDSVGTVVGQNLRRVRRERRQTQVEAAHFLGEHGLDWTRDHLNNVELGRRPAIELNVLWLLSWAYDLPLSAWFEGDGEVLLSDTTSTTRKKIRSALGSVQAPPVAIHGDLVTLVTEKLRADPSRVADAAVAQRLNVAQKRVEEAAHKLWGRTVTEERDRRLGNTDGLSTRTLQAKRGAMTRQLTSELRSHLGGGV